MTRGQYGVRRDTNEVVILRIYRGVIHHMQFRWTEWLMLWPAFGMWIVLQVDPVMFSKSASFVYLAQYATESTWATVLGFLGVLRLFALTVNGTFEGFAFSPHIRAATALIGVLIWSRFSLGIFMAAVNSEGAWSGVVAWSLPVIIELVNTYRAWSDVRREHD
jgi:hypothetical protein